MTTSGSARKVVIAIAFIAAAAPGVRAQDPPTPKVLQDIGIDQKLNEQVPLDLVFRDEAGNRVKLGDYFGEKPVILTLVYYKCPMLCTLVLNGLLDAMQSLRFTAGKEFEVVTVSFDPNETPELAATKKRNYLEKYDREGAEKGWHFLTGDAESIRRLTQAVGFRYAWDDKTQQYAHASGLMVLTPKGRLARYFYGIQFRERDLQFGLMDAAGERIGSKVDQILLMCFHYDPVTGKYGLAIMNMIRAFGLLTVLAIGSFMFVSLRKERRARRQTAESVDAGGQTPIDA